MSTSKTTVVALVAAMLGLASTLAAQPWRQRGMRNQAAVNASRLDDQTRKAILSALDDERRIKAFYKAIIAKHGEVRPFSNLVGAEGRHESALLALADKYNIKAPADDWDSKKIETPETLAAAFQQAIKFEKENVAMYDGFLKTIQQEDICNVMKQLRWASEERHLPALERCGGGQGRGPGWQGGNGRGGCCPACGAVGGGRGRGAGMGAGGGGGRGAGMGAGGGGGRGAGWQGGRGGGRGAGWQGGQGAGGPGGGRGWRGGWDQ